MNDNRKKFEQLTRLDKQIINLIIKQDTGHAQKCILSAVEHLRKAYIIKDIDPEMAHFRIIYASEKGISKFSGNIDEGFEFYYNKIFKLIRIYALLYPYKNEKFDFVQNAIDAFVCMMNDIEM